MFIRNIGMQPRLQDTTQKTTICATLLFISCCVTLNQLLGLWSVERGWLRIMSTEVVVAYLEPRAAKQNSQKYSAMMGECAV
jgi:hypothetical protein